MLLAFKRGNLVSVTFSPSLIALLKRRVPRVSSFYNELQARQMLLQSLIKHVLKYYTTGITALLTSPGPQTQFQGTGAVTKMQWAHTPTYPLDDSDFDALKVWTDRQRL